MAVTKAKTSAGKETASQTAARAKAMLAQTKAEGSKSFKGSSYEKDYKAGKYDTTAPVITPEKMTPVQTPELPSAQQDTTDYWSMLTQGNAAMAGTGLEYDATNAQLKPAQVDPTMKMLMDVMNETPNTEDIYNKSMKESGLLQAQKEVNNYSSQLNAITSKAQADQLRLEGQGRGITDVIIGGQQAQIAREAAIQALPIQAQLAAAQGNMEMAQQRLTMLFQVRSQDAQARYQTRVNMANALVQYADKKQAQQLELYKMNRQEAFQREMDQLGFQHQKDMLALQESYKTTGSPKIETQLIGDTLYERDPATGKWNPVAGGSAQTTDTTNLSAKYDSLLNDIGKARELKDYVGMGYLERNARDAFDGNNPGAQLRNITDTIKSNLLTMNTDANIKKFFGPQMSNRDTELMTAASGTLDPVKQDPAEFEKDLQDAADLIIRARTAVRLGLSDGDLSKAQTITDYDALTPDGLQVIFID